MTNMTDHLEIDAIYREAKPGPVFWLRYVLHEDEAQKTGKAFHPLQDGRVAVWTTYNGYKDREEWSLKAMPVEEARALYRKLINETEEMGNGHWIYTWEKGTLPGST